MIRIIIIAHGNFAEEILKSAERAAGKQDEVYALNMAQEDSLESLKKKIDALFQDGNNIDGSLVFVDMIGGTPFNACSGLISMPNTEVAAGVNLPMLLSAFINRKNMNVSQLADKVCLDGQKTINTLNRLLKNR